jgi:hypothetical protein
MSKAFHKFSRELIKNKSFKGSKKSANKCGSLQK